MPRLKEPKRRLWSRREYYRLADLGLFRGQRVELVAGEVVEKPPQKDTHVISVSLCAKAVATAFGPGLWVRTQAPLNLGPYDDPEPDVAVVAGSERDYLGLDNRATALLLIEVSDTTLLFDRGRKARRYARAGIADYWIVNLVERRLEVRRDPISQGGAYSYARIIVLEPHQSMAPLDAPQSAMKVADLLS